MAHDEDTDKDNNNDKDDEPSFQDAQEGPTENDQMESGPQEDVEEESPPEEEDSRYKDGQILTFIRVRFPGHAKSIPFLLGNRHFSYGQKVVAMSDRGMAVGYINSFPYKRAFDKTMLPIRHVSKAATDEDLQRQKQNLSAEKSAEGVCLRYIDKYKLDMILTHVELVQFGKKAVFYFIAPSRVDFRALVKDLVGELKMRIELRQISVRDRAAALGAVGPCGLGTCCSNFLEHYGNVSIKMAKNQNLTLLPGKLNGCCGQIKCCIRYENEVYANKRQLLPKEGSIIQAANGDIGRVQRLHVLEEQFEMITTEGRIRRYVSDQFSNGKMMPEEFKFPTIFENVFHETSKVIGLEEKKPSQLLASSEDLPDEPVAINERDDDDDDDDDGDELEDEAELNDESERDESGDKKKLVQERPATTQPNQNSQRSNSNNDRPGTGQQGRNHHHRHRPRHQQNRRPPGGGGGQGGQGGQGGTGRGDGNRR